MKPSAVVLAVAAAATLAFAAPADAASCSYVAGAKTVVVSLAGGSDVVSLDRGPNGAIYDGGSPCPAGATVNNTNAIFIRDTTPNKDGDDFVGIDLSGGRLGPGYTSEGSVPTSEIEIQLYLEGGDNFVYVSGTDGPDYLSLGRFTQNNGDPVNGIDLNPADETPSNADADVIFEPAIPVNDKRNETLDVAGGPGDDTIDESGGPGFDGPLMVDTTIDGGAGDDHLAGGGGNDTLYTDPGDDTLDGGNGIDLATYGSSPNGVNIDLGNSGQQDTGAFGKDRLSHVENLGGSAHDDVLTGNDRINWLSGGVGDDILAGRGDSDGLDGGPGTDTVSYRVPPPGATTGVTVDLAKTLQQNTGGAGTDTLENDENVWGSPFADTLDGDGGPNSIAGFEGADSVNGHGGDDELAIRDGEADQATCGPGTDRVIADQQGVDSIFSDCETLDFAPFVPPDPGSDPGTTPPPGTDPGPPPGPPADTVAPVLDKLTLSPGTLGRVRHGRRASGTVIAYTLSEPASVTFAVARCTRVRGRACRRWKQVRGKLTAQGRPGLNTLRFRGKLAGKLLARGRYRLTATARDAAGNRSVRRVKRFRVVR
jgi:Ca2+-binding RTX toxin-like protein